MSKFYQLIIFLAVIFAMASCSTTYQALYSFSLKSVEKPSDIKNTYSKAQITVVEDASATSNADTDKKIKKLNKYTFSDSIMEITWWVHQTQIDFSLRNKTGHSIKINWDDLSYVNYENKVSKVMHKGVKYTNRAEHQTPTIVPRNTTISDIIVPIDNVYFANYWRQQTLVPAYYKSMEALKANAGDYIGKEIQVLMPIEIEGVKNEYIFVFTVEEWLD